MKRLVLMLLNLSDYVIDATRDRIKTCLRRRHVSACESWVLHFQFFFFASLSDSRRIPYMKWKYQQWQTSIRPVENEKWKMEKLIFFFLIASGEMKSIDHSVAGRLVVPQSRLTRNDKTFSYLFIMWWIKDERRDYNIFRFTNFAMDFVELQVAIV